MRRFKDDARVKAHQVVTSNAWVFLAIIVADAELVAVNELLLLHGAACRTRSPWRRRRRGSTVGLIDPHHSRMPTDDICGPGSYLVPLLVLSC